MLSAAGRGAASASSRTALALFAVAGAATLLHFGRYLAYAWACIWYPFELFDAEGIVWQQAMLIPGPRMYGDITQFPFIVFHYPPVYHLLVRGAAELGLDPLAAGRAISVVAGLATAGAIAALASGVSDNGAGPRARLAGALAGGLAFFCFYPVVAVSPLLRVDMLAIALSFFGLLLAWNPGSRRGAFHVAMVLFVLSAFTKQTSIAAPVACLIVQAMVNMRIARNGALLGLLSGGSGLAWLTWETDGGFLRHLVDYNLNRYDIGVAVTLLSALLPNLILLLLGMAGASMSWQRHQLGRLIRNPSLPRLDLARDAPARLATTLVIYLILTTLMLLMLGKSGAGLNYFVEWMAVLSVFVGALVAQSLTALRGGGFAGTSRLICVVLPVLLLFQLRLSPPARDIDLDNRQQIQALRTLEERVRSATRPVLSDDMVLLMRAGKQVPWERAIFHELAAMGRWNETLITRMIDDNAFAFVISRGLENYSPAVARAIATAYPVREETGGRIVHRPN